MLLREFLLADMTNYLESMLQTKKVVNTAEEEDIEQTLNETADKKKESETKSKDVEFIKAKEFDAKAPTIVAENLEITTSDPLTENSMEHPSSGSMNHGGMSHGGIDPSQNVDDSSSLRKVIREELSWLQDSPKTSSGFQSPSQLRNAIKDELRSIIRDGGIDKIAHDETLRSIIHDELERSGAINKQKKYTPDKIHIDESLLNPSYVDDDSDVKVIEIMEKSPKLRTKRDELSVLGKLEDWLVELKMYIREGEEKQAISKFRRLKKEAYNLRFFLEEKRFLLEELRYIGTGLFPQPKNIPKMKTVIIKESSQEVMDPHDFSNHSSNQKPVYHIALDKKGKESFVDPSKRGIVVKKSLFGTEIHTQKGKSKRSSRTSHVVTPSNMWTNPLSDQATFHVTKKSQDSIPTVFHYKVPKSELIRSPSVHKVPVVLKEVTQTGETKVFTAGEKKTKPKNKTPWKNLKNKMYDPQHSKNYLRALKALRAKEKHVAVDLLSDLHDKYPKNMAIKIRLQDALKL